MPAGTSLTTSAGVLIAIPSRAPATMSGARISSMAQQHAEADRHGAAALSSRCPVQHRVNTAARRECAIARRSLITALPFLVAAVVVPAQRAEAAEVRARAVAITDGDGIVVVNDRYGQLRIRLAEIDTPEGDQPYGGVATTANNSAPEG